MLKPLSPLQISCKDHFQLTTSALDSSVFIIPVCIEITIEVCFDENIVMKCMFIDCGNVQYVVQFPSSIVFD